MKTGTLPIHVCQKAPLEPPFTLATGQHCPHCGEGLKETTELDRVRNQLGEERAALNIALIALRDIIAQGKSSPGDKKCAIAREALIQAEAIINATVLNGESR